MEDYYLDGEERFGRFSSKAYSLFSKCSTANDVYNFIIREISARNPETVLDVGTGPAAAAIGLALRLGKSKVYAVDPSPYMVKIAKKDAAGIMNIEIKEGSSRHVPFTEKFDIIYSSISFHHWKEKQQSLRYLAGRLSKSGRILIYELDRDKLNFIEKLFVGRHSITVREVKEACIGNLRVDGYKEYKKYVEISISLKNMHKK